MPAIRRLTFLLVMPLLLQISAGHSAATPQTPVASRRFHPVSAPVYRAAEYSQSGAAVASDGNGYLVVWADSRFDRGSDIVAARVAPDGTILDPTGIFVTGPDDTVYERSPAVAFDGTNYLIVWWTLEGIRGVRLSVTGSILDQEPIGLSGNQGDHPAVAYDGRNFLVAWDDLSYSRDGDIFGVRVNPAGSILDPEPISISVAPAQQIAPNLACDGSACLVVWHDTRREDGTDAFAARVSGDGRVLDPSGIRITRTSGDQGSPSVAFDGSNYLVVWSGDGLHGTFVSRAGAVKRGQSILLSPMAGISDVAFHGRQYLVVWTQFVNDQRRDVLARRVSRSGTLREPAPIAVTGGRKARWYPAVAASRRGFLAAWEGHRIGYSRDLSAARISSRGRVLDPGGQVVARSSNGQHAAAIAFDGTNHLVVWEDSRSDEEEIYAGRVSSDGRILDGTGVRISRGGGEHVSPTVAFDGTNYLVVWENRSWSQSRIVGTRVSRDGHVLDQPLLNISRAERYVEAAEPALVWSGSAYLAAWSECCNVGTSRDIVATSVLPDGTLGERIDVVTATRDESERVPTVASNGNGFLVAWEVLEHVTARIVATRLSLQGAVLDPDGIEIASFGYREPAAASDGSDYLVVWYGDYTGTYGRVEGIRVSASGDVLDEGQLSLTSNGGEYPSVAWDGRRYIAAWHDLQLGESFNVVGGRITADGRVMDPQGRPIAATTTSEQRPAVVAIGDGSVTVAFEAFAHARSLRSFRVFLRTFDNAG